MLYLSNNLTTNWLNFVSVNLLTAFAFLAEFLFDKLKGKSFEKNFLNFQSASLFTIIDIMWLSKSIQPQGILFNQL